MAGSGSRRIGAAVLVITLMGVLGGCSEAGFPDDSTMQRISNAQSVKIGIKHDQPLFGHLDDEGVPQGFDVEVARIIASELGVEEDGIDWVQAPSGSREGLLTAGEVDLVVATYSISDLRKEEVDFAGPYYVAGQSLLTRTDDASIASVVDLADKKVCSVQGSTSARTVKAMAPEANLVLYSDYSDCLGPLRDKRVDVVTTDDVILAGYAAESDGEFRLVGGAFTSEPYGIGLAKGDVELRGWVNGVLDEAVDDGRWLEAWQSTAGEVLPDPQRPYLDRYSE